MSLEHAEKRIDILDGFRAVAIIPVVLFHYYSGFNGRDGNLYLYQYPPLDAFEHGHFGVQLFFTISGFVIYRSLQHSTNVRDFLGKRYFRLLPAMVLCSIITYLLQNYLNNSEQLEPLRSEHPLNFLFSLTFIHPKVWSFILQTDVRWVDGAYWSLWAEVIFYISASLVFFYSSRGSFLSNWLKIVLLLQVTRIVTSPRLDGMTPDFLLPVSHAYYESFLFLEFSHWIYFTVGVLFYAIWSHEKIKRLDLAICGVLFFLQLYFIKETAIRGLFVLMILLWGVFVYKPRWLKFLEWKPILLVGVVSYPFYLLHENGGIVISDRIISLTSGFFPPVIVPLFVLLLMIFLSYVIFAFYERPVMRWLRNYFLTTKTDELAEERKKVGGV